MKMEEKDIVLYIRIEYFKNLENKDIVSNPEILSSINRGIKYHMSRMKNDFPTYAYYEIIGLYTKDPWIKCVNDFSRYMSENISSTSKKYFEKIYTDSKLKSEFGTYLKIHKYFYDNGNFNADMWRLIITLNTFSGKKWVVEFYNKIPQKHRDKLDILNKEMEENPPKEKTLHNEIRDKLSELLENGKSEVSCKSGRCDVVSDTFAIEVKPHQEWKHGVGQVLVYSSELKLLPILCIYGKKLTKNQIKICQRNGVSVWFVNNDKILVLSGNAPKYK